MDKYEDQNWGHVKSDVRHLVRSHLRRRALSLCKDQTQNLILSNICYRVSDQVWDQVWGQIERQIQENKNE